MSNALKSLFQKLPNGTRTTVVDLENKLSSISAELGAALSVANDAFLDKTDLGIAEAELKLKELRTQQRRVAGALHAAQARVEQNAAIEQAEETEAAWRRTEKLARQRADLSVEIEVGILKLVDHWKELKALNGEIYNTAPIRISGMHNTTLSMGSIEKALRLYLFKHGFRWATTFPWNVDDIENFSTSIKRSNAEILAKRPKQGVPT